jgi:hypothetical protein
MTRNRVAKVVERLVAGKRDRRLQVPLPERSSEHQDHLLELRPGPVQQVLPGDLCAAICAGEDDTFCAVVEMKLASYSLAEMAASLAISVATVERSLHRFRDRLAVML